jgi:hypothetical protein
MDTLHNAPAPFLKVSIVKPRPMRINCERRDALLRNIGNAQAEIGRLNKLLDEIRADVLHLTTE